MIFAQTEPLEGLQSVAAWIKSFGGVALVVGLLTMAILQTIKDLLPWRRWFQKRWFVRWLRQGVQAFYNAQRHPYAPRKAGVAPGTPAPVSSSSHFRQEVQKEEASTKSRSKWSAQRFA